MLYFKDEEVEGLNPKLIQMLDDARGLAGVPFIITSGIRSLEENRALGEPDTSEHITGHAVDIYVKYSRYRFHILKALLAVGFNRIGIAPHHLHIGIDKGHDQEVIWLEIDK